MGEENGQAGYGNQDWRGSSWHGKLLIFIYFIPSTNKMKNDQSSHTQNKKISLSSCVDTLLWFMKMGFVAEPNVMCIVR